MSAPGTSSAAAAVVASARLAAPQRASVVTAAIARVPMVLARIRTAPWAAVETSRRCSPTPCPHDSPQPRGPHDPTAPDAQEGPEGPSCNTLLLATAGSGLRRDGCADL